MLPKIPRVMSTQHPDNVTPPFFTQSSEMGGEDEIQEAYYAFSHLDCDEQMWDCEGKEVDIYVVRKLLARYERFFKKHPLGKEIFITLRIPNPTVEKEEAKIIFETLESIPRSYDTAKLFYKKDIPPIFEVILPMTTSSQCLNRIYYYYKEFVAGKQNLTLSPGDITIADWIGKFYPQTINVIPLFEDKQYLLEAHHILSEYLKDKKFPYHRVFLARSDPALNYGMISAVLLIKISLQRLRKLSERLEKPIYPILGVGTVPFRGNFRPDNVRNLCFEFPDVQTFTVQSAFKYDFPVQEVISAIQKLKQTPRLHGWVVDEEKCLKIIDKVSMAYAKQVEALAPLINKVARYVPKRRRRKLHIGLFGYSRKLGGIILPRAIGFCAACYSLGLPPEILGFHALDDKDIVFLKDVYVDFEQSMGNALKFFNEKVLDILPKDTSKSVKTAWEKLCELFSFEIDLEHKQITSHIINDLKFEHYEIISSLVTEAAHIRNFLG